MRRVELIRLQTTPSLDIQDLYDEMQKLRNSVERQPEMIRCYQHAGGLHDLCIMLFWSQERSVETRSALGFRLVQYLSEFGMVSHSIWRDLTAEAVGCNGQKGGD